MRYIAVPPGTGNRTEPRIYAIEIVLSGKEALRRFGSSGRIGVPPYYRVIGMNDGQLSLQRLEEGTDEFNYVRKWVGPDVKENRDFVRYITLSNKRRILNVPNASCNVTKKGVIKLLSE